MLQGGICALYRNALAGLESEQHDCCNGSEVRSEAVRADCGHSRVQTVPDGGETHAHKLRIQDLCHFNNIFFGL